MGISERQERIVAALVMGEGRKTIAHRQGVTLRTVHRDIETVMRRWGVTNVTALGYEYRRRLERRKPRPPMPDQLELLR